MVITENSVKFCYFRLPDNKGIAYLITEKCELLGTRKAMCFQKQTVAWWSLTDSVL